VFWFALGMGLAIASVTLAGRPLPPWLAAVTSKPLIPWAAAAAIYAVIAAALPTSPFLLGSGEQISAHVAFGVIAFLLMLPAVFGDGDGGAPRRLLANPVVAWLGLISYGIFLWHYVVAYELGIGGGDLSFWPLLGATVAISVVAAAISYYVVERPLLRFK
jgi:peptidoglycan/LPS O-acetylase OafA/YrhL